MNMLKVTKQRNLVTIKVKKITHTGKDVAICIKKQIDKC